MAPPRKRHRQLRTAAEAARATKKWCELGKGTVSIADSEVRSSHVHEDEPSGSVLELTTQREDAPHSESEVEDPTDASMKPNGEHMKESFCEEWVTHSGFENMQSFPWAFLDFSASVTSWHGED